MYPQPDFTGAFLLAAVPTLLVYLMGGSHWVLRGQGQRAWRALALLLGLPLVIVGHFVVAVYSTRGGGLLVAAWVIAPAFLLGIFWWNLSKHPAAEPGTASRRNKAALGGFAVLAVALGWHWYGPGRVPPPLSPERLLNFWNFADVRVSDDGARIWIAAASGWVLHSGDGGHAWRWLDMGTRGRFTSLHVSADGSHLWAAGRDGLIVHSGDAGRSWRVQRNGALRDVHTGPVRQPSAPLKSSPDGVHRSLWGTGPPMHSHDGGRTWEVLATGTERNLESITFAADNLTGWAAGQGATLLHTRDGGRTWQPRELPAGGDFRSISFSSDGRIGAVLTSGGNALMTTRDGGATWALLRLYEVVAPYTTVRVSGSRIFVPPVGVGQLRFTRSATYVSNDQGMTWTGVKAGPGGQAEKLVRTSDNGTSWHEVAVPAEAVATAGRTEWFIESEQVWVTRDDALSWKPVAWQPARRFSGSGPNAAAFASDGRGWIVGNRGTIVAERAGDGWKTVVPEPVLPSNPVIDSSHASAPIRPLLTWDSLPQAWSLDAMTLGEVWRARRQGEGWCTAWVFATAGGTRRPVAMIARHPEYGHPGPGVVKLDHSLRSVQPWHDQRTDKRAGMSFVVRNFAALPDGLVQADSFATGVGLGFVSEDVHVVRRRGICTYGFGRCRTYAGAFTAMWKVPELQSHGYGGGPDAIAVPQPIYLLVEDSCPWTPAGAVEGFSRDPGAGARIARFLELGP